MHKHPLAKYTILILVVISITLTSPHKVNGQTDLLLIIDPKPQTRLPTGQPYIITGKVLFANEKPLGYLNSAIHFQGNGYIDYEKIRIDESYVCSLLVRIDSDSRDWNTLIDHSRFRVWTWPPEGKTETQIAFTTWNTKNEEIHCYGNVPTDKWIQLILISTSTTQTIILNGSTLTSIPVDESLKTGYSKIRVGSGIDNGLSFKGAVDELNIYATKLSDTEIKFIAMKEYPQKGLTLSVDFDGDTNPKTGISSPSGPFQWINGLIRAEILLTPGESTPQRITVNSTTGAFTSYLKTPDKAGAYTITAQIVNPITSSKFVFPATFDNLDLKEKGFETKNNRNIFWCRPIYSLDGAYLDSSAGRVLINGADATWSPTENRWDFDYTGLTQLKITNITDNKYNINQKETIEIQLPTATGNTLPWVPDLIFIGLMILLAILLIIGKAGFKVKIEPSLKKDSEQRGDYID